MSKALPIRALSTALLALVSIAARRKATIHRMAKRICKWKHRQALPQLQLIHMQVMVL